MMKKVRMCSSMLLFALSVISSSVTVSQVTIVHPKDGETIRSRHLVVKVEKLDLKGYVMIWLDDKFISAVSEPFELKIDLASHEIFSGEHTLRVLGRDAVGKIEGESQVQFFVDLTGKGIGIDGAQLIFKGKIGEFNFYTLQASSSTKIEVPLKAIREKIPQLSTKLTLRWYQLIRDITPDHQLRVIRTIEDGSLERMAVVYPFRAIEGQGVGMFSLLPSGDIARGISLSNVIQFVTGNTDITVPERKLKIGEKWVNFIILPHNLENISLTGGGQQGQTGEVLLADVPIVKPYPNIFHKLDGFEVWNDKLCARIISNFDKIEKVKVTLDLSQLTGATGGAGAITGPTGQQYPKKLVGYAIGSRTLLFDLEDGKVVYVKLEFKVTFDTDYLTVLPLLPQGAQMPTGAPSQTFLNAPAKIYYTLTVENSLNNSQRIDQAIKTLIEALSSLKGKLPLIQRRDR